MRKIDIQITGAKCEKCVDKIERFVGECDGVEFISVDLKNQKVQVEFSAEDENAKIQEIKDAIEEAGFDIQA